MTKQGRKPGTIVRGSYVWRLLNMEVGDYFYTVHEQRSFSSYFPRAKRIDPDKHWTTYEYWAVPVNQHAQPEIITRVTRTR